MPDGQSASPSPPSAPIEHATGHHTVTTMGAEEAPANPVPLMSQGPASAIVSPVSHKNLAQQMQVFLTRTDMQQSRKNRFYLQQVFELLSELDQHTARRGQLQTSMQETEAHIKRIRQSLVEIAGESVEAENEALAIAQARAHLAALLRDKIVQEFE